MKEVEWTRMRFEEPHESGYYFVSDGKNVWFDYWNDKYTIWRDDTRGSITHFAKIEMPERPTNK